MKIKIIEECGFDAAMKGLSRSFNRPVSEMPRVALGLGDKDKGNNKFLESMVVWLEVDAPRYWWSEFDTYRAGMTKQSDSTMHTLKDRLLLQEDFEYNIQPSYLIYLNSCIEGKMPIERMKNALPDGFIQGRTLCTNYKALRNIILQRSSHKLPQWKAFCETMKELKYYKYMGIKDVIQSKITQ